VVGCLGRIARVYIYIYIYIYIDTCIHTYMYVQVWFHLG
jgi:hypothetical protein